MKKLILGFSILALSTLSFISCDNVGIGEDATDTGKVIPSTVDGIYGKGIVNPQTRTDSHVDTLAFTDENIEWFNSVTREIRFKDIEPGKNLTPYKQIEFLLDGEILFTAATIVSDINSQVYYDLVLYIDRTGGDYRYYLNDAYPLWAADTDEAKANVAARADGWAKFLEYLRKDNRLREYDDRDPGCGTDPGGNEPEPYIPDTPHNDIGDIELIRFTQNGYWNFVELEPNALNVIRNEDGLKNLITSNSYSASGIDFKKYTLLLVRVCTSNGIQEISYALNNAPDGGYAYSMSVMMNNACVIGNEICAALAPAIGSDKTISFNFKILDTVEE